MEFILAILECNYEFNWTNFYKIKYIIQNFKK